jgi:hypothetical protein
MSAPTRSRNAAGHSAGIWRRVGLALLVLVVGMAPVVKAACELEHVAAVGHHDDSSPQAQGAPSAPEHAPHGSEDLCCGHPAVASANHAAWSALAGDAPIVPAALPTPVFAPPAVPPALARAYLRRYTSLPPPEPVFRRVPRLLI